MSATATNETAEETVADERCASCGTAGGNDVTLKNCNGCFLVKYCGVECQRNHRSEHKRACKKRAAELKDELLFKQPESTDLGDCPICQLPIPLERTQDERRYATYPCCSKVVCIGCMHANLLREREERLALSCPFCRRPVPKSKKEINLLIKKRAEANDPFALCSLGRDHSREGDCATATQYWKKAALLGNIASHFQLAGAYYEGRDGVEKDMKKEIYHLEQAAIGGHVFARHNLGVVEEQNGNIERAVKHFTIAANLGDDESMKELKEGYSRGVVSKEDFEAALRAHKAVDAMKSPQRDEAEAALRMM